MAVVRLTVRPTNEDTPALDSALDSSSSGQELCGFALSGFVSALALESGETGQCSSKRGSLATQQVPGGARWFKA